MIYYIQFYFKTPYDFCKQLQSGDGPLGADSDTLVRGTFRQRNHPELPLSQMDIQAGGISRL